MPESKAARLVVYTAIFGGRDALLDPEFVSTNTDYVCFTDGAQVRSKVWRVIRSTPMFLDPVMSAKVYKLLPGNFFLDHASSIWVDGNMQIIGDLRDLLGYLRDDVSFAAFDHRNNYHDSVGCIYDEAEQLLAAVRRKEHRGLDPQPIVSHVAKLKAEGYPPENGLVTGSVLVRHHHDPTCIAAMRLWWYEVLYGSRRDELSFNYVAWKLGYPFVYIDGDSRGSNGYFRYHEHLS